MGLLADHEGLWETGRLVPAAAVAVSLVLVGVGVALALKRAAARSGSTAARGMAAAGLCFVLMGAVAGLIPREADGGYNICGPTLHLFRDDSEYCAEALSPLPRLVVLGLVAALVAFASAAIAVTTRRGRSTTDAGDRVLSP